MAKLEHDNTCTQKCGPLAFMPLHLFTMSRVKKGKGIKEDRKNPEKWEFKH